MLNNIEDILERFNIVIAYLFKCETRVTVGMYMYCAWGDLVILKNVCNAPAKTGQ